MPWQFYFGMTASFRVREGCLYVRPVTPVIQVVNVQYAVPGAYHRKRGSEV
jgi:hypothetical protein